MVHFYFLRETNVKSLKSPTTRFTELQRKIRSKVSVMLLYVGNQPNDNVRKQNRIVVKMLYWRNLAKNFQYYWMMVYCEAKIFVNFFFALIQYAQNGLLFKKNPAFSSGRWTFVQYSIDWLLFYGNDQVNTNLMSWLKNSNI